MWLSGSAHRATRVAHWVIRVVGDLLCGGVKCQRFIHPDIIPVDPNGAQTDVPARARAGVYRVCGETGPGLAGIVQAKTDLQTHLEVRNVAIHDLAANL
jgi:hypothetical protein